MREVVRMGSLIIFRLSKVMKSQVLHTVCGCISGEAAGEIWSWSLLGAKGLNKTVQGQLQRLTCIQGLIQLIELTFIVI